MEENLNAVPLGVDRSQGVGQNRGVDQNLAVGRYHRSRVLHQILRQHHLLSEKSHRLVPKGGFGRTSTYPDSWILHRPSCLRTPILAGPRFQYLRCSLQVGHRLHPNRIPAGPHFLHLRCNRQVDHLHPRIHPVRRSHPRCIRLEDRHLLYSRQVRQNRPHCSLLEVHLRQIRRQVHPHRHCSQQEVRHLQAQVLHGQQPPAHPYLPFLGQPCLAPQRLGASFRPQTGRYSFQWKWVDDTPTRSP